MDILVCIDDTDNMESRGTGQLASLLAEELEKMGWGLTRPVTRHQMLVHPDIPYTSHNSAMCFSAEIDPQFLDSFIAFAGSFLVEESAPGSDPGLCVVEVSRLADVDALMDFGKRAKSEIMTKDQAYALAEQLHVHLSEHGGTGLGIIGALAGCGLRLTGNDGRFKGHFRVRSEDNRLCVSELIRQTGVDLVQGLDGTPLGADDVVEIGEKVKAVLLGGKSILLVYADSNNGGAWRTCSRQQLRVY